eukprot:TRINITY_DN7005_c0_g3_i2.p1 TRINITY_DN7005_c0_g3~~TRINITY_DN7005_c0_g3_i2.p1  ORF type:complete len:224 (+),score=31.62 TRINITY_DN7005_c0_g3_i2:99-770(+)
MGSTQSTWGKRCDHMRLVLFALLLGLSVSYRLTPLQSCFAAIDAVLRTPVQNFTYQEYRDTLKNLRAVDKLIENLTAVNTTCKVFFDKHNETRKSGVHLEKVYEFFAVVTKASTNLRNRLDEYVENGSGDTGYLKERTSEISQGVRKIFENLSKTVYYGYQSVETPTCKKAVEKLGPIPFDKYQPGDFLVFIYDTAQACETQSSLIDPPNRLSLIEKMLRRFR